MITFHDGNLREVEEITAGLEELSACHHGGVAVPGAVKVVKKKAPKEQSFTCV